MQGHYGLGKVYLLDEDSIFWHHPEESKKSFETTVENALRDLQTQDTPELHVHLASHGQYGYLVTHMSGDPLRAFTPLQTLLSSAEQFMRSTGKTLTINFSVAACQSGSFIDNAKDLVLRANRKTDVVPVLNVLVASDRGNSQADQLANTILNATQFLKDLGPSAARICPGCSDFQRAAKIIHRYFWAGGVYSGRNASPTAWSSQVDLDFWTQPEIDEFMNGIKKLQDRYPEVYRLATGQQLLENPGDR